MNDRPPVLIELPDHLIGSRVLLRPWREADAAEFYALVDQSRAHIARWLPWPEFYHSVDDALGFMRRMAAQWLTREEFTFGIIAPSGELLGSVGLHPRDWRIPSFEIGYWIGEPHQGKGYVTEAVGLVSRFAFETLGAERVQIRCDAGNERSANVARRCGFQYEGTMLHDFRTHTDELRDTMLFAKIREK